MGFDATPVEDENDSNNDNNNKSSSNEYFFSKLKDLFQPVLQFGTIFLLSLPLKANTMDEELEREATCAKIAQVHKEGKRMVKVLVNLINQKN